MALLALAHDGPHRRQDVERVAERRQGVNDTLMGSVGKVEVGGRVGPRRPRASVRRGRSPQPSPSHRLPSGGVDRERGDFR